MDCRFNRFYRIVVGPLRAIVRQVHAVVQTLHARSLLLFFILLISCSPKTPMVTIHTDFGDITVELYMKEAPVTVTNFLDHVEKGTYQNSMFYRVVNDDNQAHNNVKIDVIQGGLFYDSIVDTQAVIIHESTEATGIKHLDGTLSMARMEPGTASTEFFICVGDQPELDYMGKRNPDEQGFAAFGKVIKGMDVVNTIHKLPDTGQYLNQFVMISNITLE
jgi:peptidyl-prolyl cis-trans isomerase A (cyclophilin A)